MRLPSMTMASLRADGFPEPSIRVPLRTTKVFLAALIKPLRRNCFACAIIPQRPRVSCPGQRGEAMRGDDIADLLAAVDMGAHHGADVAVKLRGAAFRLGLELGAEIGTFRAVDLDQSAAERHLHVFVVLQSGIEVAVGITEAVGEAGGIERRLGGAGAGMGAG